MNAMDWTRQPPRESSRKLERATSAQVYDRRVKRLAPLLCLFVLAGCSRDHEANLPDVCTSDSGAFARALRTAPDPVRVDGVALSQCLAKDSAQDDVQVVGFLLLEAAQRLHDERRALPLGYLVGAVRRGAQQSQGIHLELVRRIEQEGAPFEGSRAFITGERAGRTSG